MVGFLKGNQEDGTRCHVVLGLGVREGVSTKIDSRQGEVRFQGTQN